MTSFFHHKGSVSDDCNLVVRGDEIALSYEDEPGRNVVWKGREVSPGHFALKREDGRGTGTLHRPSPDAESFEGGWQERYEDGVVDEGMWTIDIVEE